MTLVKETTQREDEAKKISTLEWARSKSLKGINRCLNI